MRIWKRLAIASVISAGIAMPAFAGDGDGMQSRENQLGNFVERNPVMTPPNQATSPTPSWSGQTYGSSAAIPQPDLNASPAPAVVSPGMTSDSPSAAQQSRATGKVDAQEAAPPQTGSDVQAGDMGPSSSKAQ